MRFWTQQLDELHLLFEARVASAHRPDLLTAYTRAVLITAAGPPCSGREMLAAQILARPDIALARALTASHQQQAATVLTNPRPDQGPGTAS